MATEFVLPNLGEGIDEADVTNVYVHEGDRLELDQAVIEIETEKATVDVPSEVVGRVQSILVSVGDTIRPGQAILTVGSATGAEAAPASAPEPAPQAPEPAPADTAAAAPPAATTPTTIAPAGEQAEPESSSVAAPAATEKPETPAPASAAARGLDDATPAFASPSTRKFAREIGVDVHAVEGTGPGGRISESDIKRYARQQPPTAASATAAVIPTQPDLPDFARYGPIERQKLSRFRRTVARNMATSWDQIPRVSLQHMADVTDLEEFRQNQKQRVVEAGGSLTITAILVKIAATALRAHPRVNSSLDLANGELILKHHYHIGVAVDTDRGLVVPVIRDVDEKNFIEIGVELTELSERARQNELGLEEMRGGTFTVTNLGGLGTGFFSPVINWPEVAILAVGRAEQTPVYRGDTVVPRLRLPLTLAFDHRAFDGADAARFMSWMVDAINQPLMLALEG